MQMAVPQVVESQAAAWPSPQVPALLWKPKHSPPPDSQTVLQSAMVESMPIRHSVAVSEQLL
jgi:hypothetical protein